MYCLFLIAAVILLSIAILLLLRQDSCFWTKALSDNGTPSLSRIATAFVVICACVWISVIVAHNYALPELTGINVFIGTLYGLNSAMNAYKLRQIAQTDTTTPDSAPK